MSALSIMTDRGWRPFYEMSPCPPPVKWWHFAHSDLVAYERQFKRPDGTDIRDDAVYADDLGEAS